MASDRGEGRRPGRSPAADTRRKGVAKGLSRKIDPLLLLAAKRASFEDVSTLGERMPKAMSARIGDLPIGLHSLTGMMSTTAVTHFLADDNVPLLLDSSNRDQIIQRIERWGGKAVKIGDSVVSGSVPRKRLMELAMLEAVNYVEANVRLSYYCDLAHGSAALLEDGLRTVPEEGDGVLIGIVDSGIDAGHNAFRSQTATRIVDYLDQTTGARYDSAAIERGDAVASPDEVGHGTHVAGIAAGNGRDSPDGRWAGVAPRADLAIVKTTMDSVDVANGIAHIFDLAEERDQPCVVNLSLGGHFGGHDGSSVIERAIDQLSGPGRIVVAAAGNEGGSRLHAGVDLDPGRPQPARWVADFQLERQFLDGQLLGYLMVQVWHRHEDTLSIHLRSPSGELLAAPDVDESEFDRGSIYVVASRRQAAYSGDDVTTFKIFTMPFPNLLSGWSIIVSEASLGDAPVGSVNAWILDREMGHFTQGHRSSNLVGMPGTAFSVVTVASYATRREWISSTPERMPDLQAINLENISYFSSPGPTRDRTNKPEIAAPGQWVLAPLSSRAAVSHAPDWTRVDGHPYAAMQGTSMASPYVAGAVALLLQRHPTLDWAEVKRRLMKSARRDSHTRPSWNARWGYGKLDVRRLLDIDPSADA